MKDEDDLSAAPPTIDSVEQLLAKAVEAPAAYPTLADGAVVDGRYEIQRVLGAGGMGTVYLAHDRSLDREVALKLHRTTTAAERLHREALAMAKLAHPNVVTVFEIGELEGRPFVAMEYVPGSTLRDWLDERPRTSREILLALFAVGEGLAAAHAAGLVHRDVKPDNIFVGNDGRVRVGDFGLAQLGVAAGQRVRVPIGKSTATGTVIGTPAYMAPEQIEGGELDARTDQFAFCVAAWEALCGVRPFDGADTEELHAAIRRGDPERPRRRVSSLIRRVLVRGMAANPEARWPTVRALLAALHAAERRPRLVAVAVSSSLAIGAAVVWNLWPTADPAAACAVTGGELDSLLPSSSVDATAAVVRHGRANGEDEATRIRRSVEEFRAGYRELARVTCEAHARGQWTATLLAASRECTSLRARTLRELLATAPEATTRPSDVLQIVLRAPTMVACADPRLLASWRWLVPGETATDEVIAVRARLDAAAVVVELGQFGHARRIRDDAGIATLARTNRDVARRLAYLRGTIAFAENDLKTAEALFTEVYYDSRATDDAELVLDSLTQLVDLTGRVRRDRATADRWIRDGLTEAERFQLHARASAFELLAAAAGVTGGFGNHAEALRLADIADKLVPDAHRGVALLAVRANAYAGLGDTAKAADTGAILVERLRAQLGPKHPRVADAHALHAALLLEANRSSQALVAAATAMRILDEVGSDNAGTVATAALNLGVTLLRLEDPRAASQLERARAIYVAAHGEDHPDVALVDINLALVYLDRGELERGLATLRAATAIQERTLGSEHQELAAGLYNLAVAERKAGKLEDALATSRRCATILANHESGSLRHAEATIHTANVLNLTRRFEEALAAAASALALRDTDTDPMTGAWARLEAARALIGLRRDRDRSRTLLLEARARYELLHMTARVTEIDGMLASVR